MDRPLTTAAPMLKINRHPILIDAETTVHLDLVPGESLQTFLDRHIENVNDQPMTVKIGGVEIPRQHWARLKPKDGHNIEVRFGVGKTALFIVAMIALTIFTMGAAAAVAAAASGAAVGTGVAAGFVAGMAAAGISAAAQMAIIGAIQVVGAMVINKVLGPKPPGASRTERDSVFNVNGVRNQVRQYEPMGLLVGDDVPVSPDVISIPYSYYKNNDNYMGFVLSPGINVATFGDLYIGDTLLSTYQNVQTWTAGFPGKPQDKIPLFTNVDQVAGGELEADFNVPGPWMVRTTSPNTIRIQIDITYLLFDKTSKGKDKDNQETIVAEYRKVGDATWLNFQTIGLINKNATSQRRTYSKDVAEGQYEVRVRRLGRDTDGSGATANFQWATLTSVQADNASYAGIPRIAIEIMATGQLSGTPDQINAKMRAKPMPFWDGNQWTTATDRTNGLSNQGAFCLQYLRGFRDENGVLIAGMGLPDSMIDIESFKGLMTHCRVNQFSYNKWIADARSHDDILSEILGSAMARYTWAPGKITALWVAQGQAAEGVVTMANIKKGEFQIDYSLMQSADGIEYTYLDRSANWEMKTLRVPAPGVTVMENPARITGEGVDNERQAAILARWHMGQNLYQYKDVVYGQDLEHLSYGQWSVVQLSHDLTQWGYSGRLISATRNGATVTLKMDTPVPGQFGTNVTPYIGLRIPGERNYRVMKVKPFQGDSDTVVLDQAWPGDAAFPGSTARNPVQDTIFLYDFKQTPGLRCRVVGISPADDLAGASISVVPESDEFWNYVLTGQYIPPKNESLLRPQPQVANLKVREERVTQGDTVFSRLNATWAITGYAKYVIVTCGKVNEQPEEKARTSALTASWRADDVGQYIVTVRPYDDGDVPGIAQTMVFTVYGPDQPPVLVDTFNVEQLDGGVRKYTWGFLESTIQSPDMAGVEIRYIQGSTSSPVWDNMTPIGNDGFFTSAFEGIVPPSGTWTFALRTRNTSGILSSNAFVVTKVLSDNLGQVIDKIEIGADELTQEQIRQQQQIDANKLAQIQGDLAESQARAQAITEVNANIAQETAFRVAAVKQVADNLVVTNQNLAQEKLDRAAAVLNEKTERVAAVENLATTTQTQFESVAQQIGSVAAGSGTQFDSAKIWLFNTTTESWTSNGTPTVVDGMLRPANSTTAYAQSPVGLAIDSNAYRFIKTRIKRVGTPPWRGMVRWITDADQTWDDAKSVTIPAPSFDANGIATVDISDIPWNGASPIRAVRMALVTTQTAASYLLYDYVAIGRPSPGASTALVQEVQTALQQQDQVIASSVTTLGVQMRGQYTGSDATQLTSGLLYQEMQARATADGVQVQRIFAMESRMPLGSGLLASDARVTQLEQATTTTTTALAQSITTINTTLPAMVAQGSNMVLNGGWDQGDTVGWSYSNMAGVSIVAEGRNGKCLKVTAPSGNRSMTANGATDPNLPVVLGKKYRISAYYKTDAAYNGTSGNGKIRLANQDGGLIAGLAFSANKTDWTRLEYLITATTISQLRVYVNTDHTAGTLWVDDVMVEEVTDVLANADGLQALTTTVTNQGGQITAQGNLISALRTDVDGKASNAALQTLQSQVTLQGNDITSLGTAITNVSASLGNVGGDNLLGNSGFEQSGVGWTSGNSGLSGGTVTRTYVASSLPSSKLAARWDIANVPTTGYWEFATTSASKTIAVEPGKPVTMSTYVRGTPGARVFLQFRWQDANNQTISYSGTSADPVNRVTAAAWDRKSFTATAPATAAFCQIYLRAYGLGLADQWVEWDNVQVQLGNVASGYKLSADELADQNTANANATTALTGTVTSLQGQVTSQGQAITAVNAAASAADTKATNAQTAANAAATAAGNKGKVMFQSAAPAAADRLEQNLWIDTTDNANTPKRWNGTAWVVVTDKAATDAAAAASAAQTTANQAKSTAEGAASGVSSLTGTVSTMQGTLTAQGQAITTVQATVDQANRAGSNMYLDGSFEGRPLGTAIQSWAIITTGGRTGTNALTVSHASNIRSISMGTFDVAPDRVYYAEAWAKRVGPAAGNVQLRFNVSDNGSSASYPNFQSINLSAISETEWTKVSGYVRIPAGKNRAIFQLNSANATTSATQLIWDDFVLQDVTEAYNAQQTASGAASGLTSLQATVTQQGNDITAQATRIDGVQASVNGKADAQVVQEMSVKVSNQGAGENKLANSMFPQWSTNGWAWDTNNSGFRELGDPTGGNPSYQIAGVQGIGSVSEQTVAAGASSWFGIKNRLDVTPGKRYSISAWVDCQRCSIRLEMIFFNAAGGYLGAFNTPLVTDNQGDMSKGLASLPRLSVFGVAPANAATVLFRVTVIGTGQPVPYFWMFRPMLAEVDANATQPPAWSAGGAETSAEWNLSVRADKMIAGIKVGATAETSEINFLANIVNILTPGGADGFEMTKGYLRVWSGNSQRIIGNGFGGDGLVDYFGPNVGAANANKSNATMWMDRNGNAYWGGAIAAGILRNAAQSTTTQTVGTSVLVGPFDTNGRNKQVVVGYNRRHSRTKNALGPQGFVAGAGSNGGVINLYRQLNGQAEVLWQQIPITGNVTINNEVDGPDNANSGWNASVTLNDNTDGTTRRSYRAEIVSFTEQSVTHQSGSFDGQSITQSLSIVSIEQ